jgi:hypothetical protein
MSVKFMGAIWDLDLPHELAWVLMAYADHADHDGRNCYPGTKLIAYKTSYSARQVQRCTADLLSRGILSVERQGGGRGHATVYRIDLSRAPLKMTSTDPEPVKGDNLSPFTAHSETMTPAAETMTETEETPPENAETMPKTGLKGDIAMSPQPLTVKPLTVTESLEPARGREPEQFENFTRAAHITLQRLLIRPNLRAPVWRLYPDGRLECGLWEPGAYQAAKREPLKFSVLGQDAIKHLGRRVALSFVPASEEEVCSPPGLSASSSPVAYATSSTPASSPV